MTPPVRQVASEGDLAPAAFSRQIHWHVLRWLWRLPAEVWRREPVLARFGFAMWLLMVPTWIALGLDERTLREVNVWVKPLKFMASLGLFALTTAWFMGYLSATRRAAWPARAIVWTLMISGGLEVLYIVIQAALGQASHFNVSTPFHSTMYTLMGIGALILTATQPALAWQLWRHGDRALPAAYRQAVLSGLVLTFVLGAGVGMLLGDGPPPPSGPGWPLTGWSTVAGDLRVAHFLGLHAQQMVPLMGAAVVAAGLPGPRVGVALASGAWAALCVAATAQALRGLPITLF